MKRCLWVLVAVIFCAWAGVMPVAKAAEADVQSPPILPTDGVGWAVNLDVKNGNLRVDWIITIWREVTPGVYSQVTDFRVPLNCSLVGPVAILNNAVSFNGGYLACPRPDLPSAVYTLTGGVITLPTSGHVMLFNSVLVETKVSRVMRATSIPLAWDSSGIAYNLTPPSRKVMQIQLSLADAANTPFQSNSTPFSLGSGAGVLRSEEGTCDIPLINADITHWFNGFPLNTAAGPCLFRFGMGPQTTYFGLDPNTNVTFVGLMARMYLDPASKGPGIVTACDPNEEC